MKYEKCLTCHELGKTCDGPNFLAMDASELGKWCNEKRKHDPNLTYDKVATQTGISKSTVFSFLNGEHEDFRFSTIRPIVKLITDGNWDDNPCGNITNSEKAQYEEHIHQLETEIKWRDDKIEHLTNNNNALQTLVINTNKRNEESQGFLRNQIKNKNKVIIILSILLAIFVFMIIGALVVDKLNPDMGFFWLQSLINHSTVTTGHITS